MRLDDVNALVNEFQTLAKEDVPAAVQKRNELFTLLLKRDKFYVVSDGAFGEGDIPRPIIKPIQDDSPETYMRVFTHQELAAKLGEPVKLTSLELCRLARHWFLRGVPGLIANDGASWFMMPLPDVLSLFLQMVGGDPLDTVDAEVIELYNNLQQGNHFRILHCDGAFCYFGHEDLSKTWEQALPEHLTAAQGVITTPNGTQVQPERVATVIAYLQGLSADATQYDDNSLDLIPKPEPDREEEPVAEKKPGLLTRIKGKIHLPELKLPKLPKLSGKLWRPAALVFLGLAIIILLFILVGSNSGVTKFNKAIQAGNYAQGQTIYTSLSPSNKSKADSSLSKHIKTLTQQYAAGDITEAELSAHLSALQAFPPAADDVKTAAQVASQLSASKKAYSTGVASETTADKLNAWRDVIEADIENWPAMHKDVTTNEAAYVGEVTADAQSYIDCGLYGKAYQLSQELVYWYPWNIKASALANELNDYAGDKAYSLPIEIQAVKTSIPSLANDVDLFIVWRNVSAKTIKQIDFFVTPYNEFGEEAAKPFKAIDSKGYASGEGPNSDTWGWAAAWSAGNIKKAEVTRVSVTFEDGYSRDFSIPKQ